MQNNIILVADKEVNALNDTEYQFEFQVSGHARTLIFIDASETP